MNRRWTCAAPALGLLPAIAHAHLSSTGLGPFYDGVVHLLTSPEDVAAVLALALLTGLRGAAHGRLALLVLPCAWLLGSFLGLISLMPQSNSTIAAAWLLGLGVLVAADAKLPRAVTTTLALLLGVTHGYANGSGMNLSPSVAIALLGLAVAVAVTTALPAAAVVRFGDAWRRIAIRVAGSWIAASGLLLLGWSIRAAG